MRNSLNKTPENAHSRASSFAHKGEYTLALSVLAESDDGAGDSEFSLEGKVLQLLCHASLLHSEESDALAQAVLSRVPRDSAASALCEAVSAWNLFLRGKREESSRRFKHALFVLRLHNHDAWLAIALKWIAQLHQAEGQHRDAIQSLYESVGAARRANEPAVAAEGKFILARVFRKLSQFDEALGLAREAYEEISKLGGLTVQSHLAIDLSVLSRLTGQLYESLAFANRALAIAEETKHEICRLSAIISRERTESLLSSRSKIEATTLLAQARSIGAVHQVALILEDVGDDLARCGDFAGALDKYSDSYDEIQKVAPRGEFIGELSWRIALCHVHLGDLERARTWIMRGLEHCEASGDLKEHALTLRAQGHMLLAQGNVDLGFAKINEALDRLNRLGVAFEAARTRVELAVASRDYLQDRAAFEAHLETALSSMKSMGSNFGIDWIDTIRAQAWPDVRAAAANRAHEVNEGLLDLAADDDQTLSLADLTLGVEWRAPRFVEALGRLQRFASSTQPILITGESGVGKTAFAEVAHRSGPGRDGPFIVLNCASLPDTLVESELFGSTRGAFTGADRDRSGLIRAAANGTIFLDEIDKASPAFQATILHVLDRGEVRPVGGASFQSIRVRFLFAANRDLGELAERGDFLPDLDYRISGLRVDVPPVRERTPDFDLLLALALRELRVREGQVRRIDRDARNLLVSYEWRGNVRELFSVVTAMAFLSGDEEVLTVQHVEQAFQDPRRIAHLVEARKSESLDAQMDEYEKKVLLMTLRLEGGSQARAAGRLGITRRGLNKKLHRLGLLEQIDREGLGEFSYRPADPDPESDSED